MRLAPFLLLAVAGCFGLLGPAADLDTGLRGRVLRGPVQPVCQQDEPCSDEPFAASFSVYRGSRRVATFRSAEDGRFEVALDSGTYTVVPDDDAPIMAPESQAQTVEVGEDGVTEVTLHFDTGIR